MWFCTSPEPRLFWQAFTFKTALLYNCWKWLPRRCFKMPVTHCAQFCRSLFFSLPPSCYFPCRWDTPEEVRVRALYIWVRWLSQFELRGWVVCIPVPFTALLIPVCGFVKATCRLLRFFKRLQVHVHSHVLFFSFFPSFLSISISLSLAPSFLRNCHNVGHVGEGRTEKQTNLPLL